MPPLLTSTVVCRCQCHSYFAWMVHPDAMPSIDAVSACPTCQNAHCGVLMETRVWWDAPRPSEWVDPPPPANFCNPEE